MFNAFKNLTQLPQLMAKAQKFQEEIKKMQDQLGNHRLTADAGEGRVTATVTGRMDLVELIIDRNRIDPNNISMLQDLTVAAVRAAQAKAAELVHREMERITREVGIDPNMIPGGGTLASLQ